ncbi:hypothetical protein BDQ17DRAFT_1350840 [Cyathus striatus]|nr:hypothetical protein BDQ17DRAFT_1350840 [Cyathus striatus]
MPRASRSSEERTPHSTTPVTPKTAHLWSTFALKRDAEGKQRLKEIKTHIRFLVIEKLDLSKVFKDVKEKTNEIIDDVSQIHAAHRHALKFQRVIKPQSPMFPAFEKPRAQVAPVVSPSTTRSNKVYSRITTDACRSSPTPVDPTSCNISSPIIERDERCYPMSPPSTPHKATSRMFGNNENASSSVPDSFTGSTSVTTRPLYPMLISPRHSPSPTRTNASEVSEVRDFLASCDPPMPHFLTRFMAYGCRNATFLSAVAKYSMDGIEEFIEKLSVSTDDDREMNGMEKMVLKMRFLEYDRTRG